jgi:hypothetical protein
MAEHDDELDRRITALLGLAQADAPKPADVTRPRPERTHRWIAMAAAVVVIAVGVAALTLHGEPATVSPADSTPIDTSLSETTIAETLATAQSTTPTLPSQQSTCSAPAVDSYDMVGSMHTIVESAQALDIEIESLDTPWCPGGTGVARLTVTNIGVDQERVYPIQLILNGGVNKYPLTHIGSDQEPGGLSLAPGTAITVEYHVAVPAVPPGSYLLQLYGFASSADVRIDGPLACATADLEAVAGLSDGASGNVGTPITVTNTGTRPCFLGKPLMVMATGPDGTGATQVQFSEGAFFPVVNPLPSRVLAPGARTMLVLTTHNTCLGPTTESVSWSSMQVQMSPLGNSTLNVTFHSWSHVQTACGLELSGWGDVAP